MKVRNSLLGIVLVLGASRGLEAEEFKRPSLAGLTRIGAVIVTVSTDTVPEADVRRVVKQRLAQAKIAIDGEPGPELLVNVSAERRKAEKGPCQFGVFRVRVSLRESASLERAPEQGPVAVTTWNTFASASAFSVTAPRLTIMGILDDALSNFARAVVSDTQQAEHAEAEP